MGMSTHVIGFRPADERWEQMKKIWDACQDAGVSPPQKVRDFFEDGDPDPQGVKVDIDEAVEKWNDTDATGYVVDISKLPPDLKYIRFYNSW